MPGLIIIISEFSILLECPPVSNSKWGVVVISIKSSFSLIKTLAPRERANFVAARPLFPAPKTEILISFQMILLIFEIFIIEF